MLFECCCSVAYGTQFSFHFIFNLHWENKFYCKEIFVSIFLKKIKKSPDGWAAVETCCFIVCYAPHLSQFDLVACTFPIAGSQEGDLASLEAVLRILPGMLERNSLLMVRSVLGPSVEKQNCFLLALI